MSDAKVTFEEWLGSVSAAITGDSLWKMEAYLLTMFASELGWDDVTRLSQDRRTVVLAGQLYRALGPVGANLAEGYPRGTGPDRARFCEYALGSARESRDWYYKGRHVLGQDVADQRIQLLTGLVRLLLAMVHQQRGRSLREGEEAYDA